MLDYFAHLSIILTIYLILATSLNPIVVSLGSMNMANAALFGIGAYASALVSLGISSNVAIVLVLATMLPAFAGAGLGVLSSILPEDDFAVVTLLVQLSFVVGLANLDYLGANRGLMNLPKLEFFTYELGSRNHIAALSLIILCVWLGLLVRFLSASRVAVANAIREDQQLVAIIGHSALRARCILFSVSGCGAGLAGFLYANYFTFLEPQVFSLSESFFVILAVSLFGAAGVLAPACGALILIMIPEFLRFLGLRGEHSGPVQQMAFSAALFAVLFFRSSAIRS
jgi:branched-chain amino acid transport system permease protein